MRPENISIPGALSLPTDPACMYSPLRREGGRGAGGGEGFKVYSRKACEDYTVSTQSAKQNKV